MDAEEMEAKLHTMTQLALEMDLERKSQAHERARARCLLRDDVVSVELREDGTLLCTGYDGSVCLRPAGWRGRA